MRTGKRRRQMALADTFTQSFRSHLLVINPSIYNFSNKRAEHSVRKSSDGSISAILFARTLISRDKPLYLLKYLKIEVMYVY